LSRGSRHERGARQLISCKDFAKFDAVIGRALEAPFPYQRDQMPKYLDLISSLTRSSSGRAE
jgi:hypothetical protein